MKEIDKYMTVSEAADRWGIPVETLKNKLKPSVASSWTQTEKMIEEGLIKYYQKEGGNRQWIISEAAMVRWFGEKRKKLKK